MKNKVRKIVNKYKPKTALPNTNMKILPNPISLAQPQHLNPSTNKVFKTN